MMHIHKSQPDDAESESVEEYDEELWNESSLERLCSCPRVRLLLGLGLRLWLRLRLRLRLFRLLPVVSLLSTSQRVVRRCCTALAAALLAPCCNCDAATALDCISRAFPSSQPSVALVLLRFRAAFASFFRFLRSFFAFLRFLRSFLRAFFASLRALRSLRRSVSAEPVGLLPAITYSLPKHSPATPLADADADADAILSSSSWYC